jgi:pimeloyl-ACP methyl ester carboxylesterase
MTEDIAFVASCDRSPQHYVLVRPEGVDASAAHDVLSALHGHGSDRWQFVKEERDECRAVRDVAAEHAMVLVSPDYRAATSWMGPRAESDVLDIIAEVHGSRRVHRVFLCGGSMGGAASLTFAALHPDMVAGVAAMNGIANHVEYDNFQDAIQESFGGSKTQIPDEYRKRSAEFHTSSFTMPVGLTTGGQDTSTPPASVLRLAESIRLINQRLLLIHREDEGHRTNYTDARAILEFILTRATVTGRAAP